MRFDARRKVQHDVCLRIWKLECSGHVTRTDEEQKYSEVIRVCLPSYERTSKGIQAHGFQAARLCNGSNRLKPSYTFHGVHLLRRLNATAMIEFKLLPFEVLGEVDCSKTQTQSAVRQPNFVWSSEKQGLAAWVTGGKKATKGLRPGGSKGWSFPTEALVQSPVQDEPKIGQ